MAKPDVFDSAVALAERIHEGAVSPADLVDAYLERIEARSSEVNAYITVLAEEAREAAKEAERAVERGDDLGPLHGLPVAFKDLSASKAGVRHTFGSSVFADNIATKTSPFVARLEEAGAITLGKTNLPPFGYKPKTENDLVGATSTPYDPSRNAGGSSGGSAAAVGDGQVAFAQGGDAGGSVRIPSAFCGVFGLKPSFGRIPSPSRPDAFGAHTPFTDRGLHTRYVADAALALEVMAGPHFRDPFSLPNDGTEYLASVERDVSDLTVGYSPDLDVFPVDEAVGQTVADAVEGLREAGMSVDEVDLDFGRSLEDLVENVRQPVMQVKTAALAENIESGHSVEITGGDRDRFPEDFVARAEAGYEYSAVEFKQSDVVRTEVYDTIGRVLNEYDLLVSPTTGVVPFRNDEPGPTEVDGRETDPLADWFLTWPFNLTGHPVASVPAGLVDGLPVGMQVAGRRFADDDVLAASAAFEGIRPWHSNFPT
jgi:Asp-tRNA(Asn)/Glu-tRNA(Gln) amidotransferase A subunit family amidase